MKIAIAAILATMMLGNYAFAQARVTINGASMSPQQGPTASDFKAALERVLSQRDREQSDAIESAVKTNRMVEQIDATREQELEAWAAQVQGYMDEIAALKGESKPANEKP